MMLKSLKLIHSWYLWLLVCESYVYKSCCLVIVFANNRKTNTRKDIQNSVNRIYFKSEICFLVLNNCLFCVIKLLNFTYITHFLLQSRNFFARTLFFCVWGLISAHFIVTNNDTCLSTFCYDLESTCHTFNMSYCRLLAHNCLLNKNTFSVTPSWADSFNVLAYIKTMDVIWKGKISGKEDWYNSSKHADTNSILSIVIGSPVTLRGSDRGNTVLYRWESQ